MMDSATTSFPSILSHMTNAILNHEVLALPVLPKRRGIPPLQTFAPLKSILPCDFHLLNLRSIQSQVMRQKITTMQILASGILCVDFETNVCACMCARAAGPPLSISIHGLDSSPSGAGLWP